MNKLLTVFFTSFLIIFSNISFVFAPINLGGKETMYDNKLKNILLDITSNYFPPGQFIHMVMSEDYSLSWFWDNLLQKDLFEKWSIVITYPNEEVYGNTTEHPDVVVIFFNNYQGLMQLCNILRNASQSWNPAAKFLLITAMTNTHPKTAMDKEFAMAIFNYLWSMNVLRVSLVVSNEIAKNASLFSASPYSTFYKTCKKIDNISQLQEINLVSESNSRKIAGFQFEPPNSFFGCSLIGHTFPFPPYSIADTSSSNGCRVYSSGIEVQLLELMGNVYNFSLEIRSTIPSSGTGSEWVKEYPNGTRTGMLEDLVQNKMDFAFAGAIPPSNLYFQLSIANTYIDSSMSWYVPGAQMIPIWKLVLNTFSSVAWLFNFSLLLLVTMLYYSMNGFRRTKDEEPVDLTMLALSLGFSIRWTRRSRLRILLLAWSLFCFHIALMFNTRLFSVLTGPPFDLGIETIQQLHDSKLKTCTFSSYKNFYVSKTDGIMRDLVKSAHVCDSLEESLKVLMEYKNFSILAKDDHMALKIDNKIENIHRVKDSKFINYPVVIPLAKGSVFLDVLNKIVFNITESGLIFKWLNDVRRKYKNKFVSIEIQDSNTVNYLVTRDFIWLYFLFLGGQAIAFMVFLIEMYVKSIR